MEQANEASGGVVEGRSTFVIDPRPESFVPIMAIDPAEFFGVPEADDVPEPIAASDAVTVSVSRATLRLLVLGADGLRELWNKAVVNEDPAVVDLIVPLLDLLTEAGIISAEDGLSSEAFDLACTLGGIALGIDAGGGEYPTNDGEGVDGLAGADNDDFADDVAAAEDSFFEVHARQAGVERSADPDWPGEPVVSVLDLPKASGFGGD
jgi:hypothetical protein